MQRYKALQKLSSDHHAGLVLARRARHAANENLREQSVAWQTIVSRFQTEMEAHFRLEETGLLPAMLRVGETELVERTLREHETLRLLIAENDVKNMPRFAELLTAHIRFEEKELFEMAQCRLDKEAWEIIVAEP